MQIILVHGLWYGPRSMAFLARRLRLTGFTVRLFAYRPTASTVAAHARQLARFARPSDARTVHFVGHSLGGLVIAQLLAGGQWLAPGRAVLLGTPLQGSRVAGKALQLPGGSVLLGQAASDLCRGQPRPAQGREIAMIAGCRALGLGRLFGCSGVASDGTVELTEADAPGLGERLVLPVSHTGMLYSREVARQVGSFLQDGRFSLPAATRGKPYS